MKIDQKKLFPAGINKAGFIVSEALLSAAGNNL
jgi:hypothetical protein